MREICLACLTELPVSEFRLYRVGSTKEPPICMRCEHLLDLGPTWLVMRVEQWRELAEKENRRLREEVRPHAQEFMDALRRMGK